MAQATTSADQASDQERVVSQATRYPDDATLIARGKLATLRAERKKQLERVQKIVTSIVTEAHATLRDCEAMPPVNSAPIATLERCMENLQDARERILDLADEMIKIQPIAWPK